MTTPTSNQMGASIAPGSTEYGQRQEFEAALGGLAASRRGGATMPAQGPPPGAMDSGDDLLSMLTGGDIPPPDGQPATDGLSRGPGAGPPASLTASSVPTALEDRLRLVAIHAKSPHLRAMARLALRRMVYRRVKPRE